MDYITYYNSPMGRLILGSDGENLTGIWIREEDYLKEAQGRETEEQEGLPIFSQTSSWLDRYFAGEKPEISELPLKLEGTLFRMEVWKLLCEIPYGETTTYGKIAKKIAAKMGKEKMSAQAVGGAVGHNPIPIVVPCHRVIGADGSMTGFSCGMENKIWLLTHEGFLKDDN